MADLSNCKAGKHELKIIYRGCRVGDLSEEMVRWCVNCGSVVVDVDFDGRTNPGSIMKIKNPRVAKSINE